ncbi:hypothetical protein [Microlunatus sp. Y2014]|uniref:hypothetical protein n=1 Tax=Microlunatus sp. Y2014 TaxID=3418488 RepID=UPI003DA713DD
MTTRTQQPTTRRWVLVYLAALVAVLATLLSSVSASAATPGVAETRVGASSVVVEPLVGPPEHIAAGQRLGNEAPRVVTVVATGVAANAGVRALPAFPKALSGGPANTHVYLGVRNGKPVYGGITTNIGRRSSQHGDRFDQLRQVTTEPLTRGQARSVEQALIVRNGAGFENKINSISPKHSYYGDAVNWGEAWLKQNGY